VNFESDIQKCLEVLQAGGIILYPTDTLWGIGCDATHEKAVEKIISIKEKTAASTSEGVRWNLSDKVRSPSFQRTESPSDLKREKDNANNTLAPFRAGGKSFIVLISDDGMLKRFVKEVPAQAWDLIEVSDNPITIIYDAARGLAKNVLAEDGSIGVRKVEDDFCQRLIHKFGKPIVSTSANVSEDPSPKNYNEISEEIKNKVDYTVNWRQDDFTKRKTSSIIKLKGNGEFVILRK